MIVVSDTSSLLALAVVNRLDLLQRLFDAVVIPQAVFSELAASSRYVIEAIQTASWITVKRASDEKLIHELESFLDRGESEAIALAKELRADLLLIDERKGRREASRLGISIIGLIGVLARAKQNDFIERIKPLIDQIIEETGFRLSIKLYQQILQQAGEVT
jgi:predicted nucleic acid-binding protein